MSELMPFSFEQQRVRMLLDLDGEPWFVARDVCDVLGIANVTNALSRLNVLDIHTMNVENSRGSRAPTKLVSESGLYRLILTSRKPEAEKFSDWVTSEVLPSIRKTGQYLPTPYTELELARKHVAALEHNEELKRRLAITGPKAELAERWLEASDSSVPVVEWSKKFGLTQNEAWQMLRDNDIVFRREDYSNNGELVHAAKRGYETCFESVQSELPNGQYTTTLRITPNGQTRIAEELQLSEAKPAGSLLDDLDEYYDDEH